MKRPIIALYIVLLSFGASARGPHYPYPVKTFSLTVEQKQVKIAYMDVPSTSPNGQTIVLFHGKNFNGYYWKDVIPFLTGLGYRVIVPDQLGFGESDKPEISYSFDQMAANSKTLLDSLRIPFVSIIGHSMGGMLAIRFAVNYPVNTDQLVLENPIGLEDYKTFVPRVSTDSLYHKELSATYRSYKKYQQSYYPVWKHSYESLVKAQAKTLDEPGFPKTARANALTYEMIYEQPVLYDLNRIKSKTLLLIGQADRTIVGKDLLRKEVADAHGQYSQLGREAQKKIEGSILVELPGVGHIPHIQEPELFKTKVKDFLRYK